MLIVNKTLNYYLKGTLTLIFEHTSYYLKETRCNNTFL